MTRSPASSGLLALALACSACATAAPAPAPVAAVPAAGLGNFSVSLAVKDLAASRAFYQQLGFAPVLGDGKRWLVLQNDTATLALFQGVLERNTLTFNPGWDRRGQPLPAFEDVREVQARLEAQGMRFAVKADPASTGPASFLVLDPDGNPVLVDQHVARPRR